MSLFSTVAEAVADVGTLHPSNGFTFQDLRGEETFYAYPEVERRTATRAAALQALGLKQGERLGLIVVEPEDFVLTFLAALRIGVIPVPLYPPLSFGALDAYAERTARVLEMSGTRILVASAKLQNILWGIVDKVDSLEKLVKAETLAQCDTAPVYPEIVPEDTAFLQYTSGSTSDPKGVIVTHGSLVANSYSIIIDGVKMDHRHTAVSWLPLYHDMGLIGFVVATLTNAMNSVFVPTLRFIKKPSVWMDAIHRHRGDISFAPNFAYALAVQKAKPAELEAWDLSCVQVFGCGAEPIQASTAHAFLDLFGEHCGLDRTSFLPAYGMAEATLAMSFKPLGQVFRTNRVDAERFQDDGVVEAPRDDEPVLEHVSCGPTFPGHELRALSDDGSLLAEGVEGELCFKGPSVTAGYFQDPERTAAAYRDGWLHTGDLGYTLDGEVYVTGRIKDLIILNGRNIHPQSLEWRAAEVDGVRKGNVVAFSRPSPSGEEVVIVIETRESEERWEQLKKDVKKRIRAEIAVAPADIVCLKPGSLPKTSSGKLQRRKARQQYLAGELGGEGSRTAGSTGSKITLAKHVARSVWSRAKNRIGGS